jgi:hypothetical protein
MSERRARDRHRDCGCEAWRFRRRSRAHRPCRRAERVRARSAQSRRSGRGVRGCARRSVMKASTRRASPQRVVSSSGQATAGRCSCPTPRRRRPSASGGVVMSHAANHSRNVTRRTSGVGTGPPRGVDLPHLAAVLAIEHQVRIANQLLFSICAGSVRGPRGSHESWQSTKCCASGGLEPRRDDHE